MATLVLTTVGTLLGGPFGGLVGGILGGQVDQALFGPKRQGPRLGDLSVQTSRYGQPIPKLFGTMRVAGTVIWSTDLIETAHSSGGGKGAPSGTTYTYAASFAVAISARRIRAVHRIWADGKLLRGAEGDWKAERADFRLYLGNEAQDVDPTIGAAEGIDNTPAYRGMAYALFDTLQLAEFANHIPSLTFEVEADADAPAVGEIVTALGEGDLVGEAAPALGGFAASGDSVRGAVETLARAAGLAFADGGGVLRIADPEAVATAIAAEDRGASADARPRAASEAERAAAGSLPDEIAISYYEPSRDYQAGLQRARRDGAARRSETIDVAAAMAADAAKAMAEARLADAWAGRVKRTVRLPWRALDLAPGGMVTLPGLSGRWRVQQVRFEKMVVEATLVGTGPGNALLPPASAGRAVAAADVVHGPTVLRLIDLPPLDDMAATAPRVWIAAAGTSLGWRRAGLMLSSDGGASYAAIGTTAGPAVMGSATTVLGDGGTMTFDLAGNVEIALLHEGMSLAGRNDDALVQGANVAMLGGELIQFGVAEQIDATTWRLSRLLRGRRGSEWACATHAIGEPFVLLETETLVAQALPLGCLGGSVRVLASGVGDPSGVEAEMPVQGRALRPPAPVHVSVARLGDGTVRIAWTRRSRAGWSWLDGGDAPLGEESERYRVEIMPSVGAARSVEIAAPGFDYSPAMQAADGASGATSAMVRIAQLGSLAGSLPPFESTFDI